MADSEAFEQACEALERETSLDRLEARGTIRIMLRQVGFDAKHVGARELRTIVEKLLEKELTNRGVSSPLDVIAVLDATLARVSDVSEQEPSESPEEVFARLGGRS